MKPMNLKILEENIFFITLCREILTKSGSQKPDNGNIGNFECMKFKTFSK